MHVSPVTRDRRRHSNALSVPGRIPNVSDHSPMSSEEVLELFQRYVIPNYGRFPIALVRGEGSYVWDAEGNRYLDLFPRLGLQPAGPLPAGGGRGRPRPARPPDPRAQHLAHRAAGALGQGALGAEFRRPGVLLQLGHGGQRGGDQARPAAHAQAAATRSSPSRADSTAARSAPPRPRPSRNTTRAWAR